MRTERARDQQQGYFLERDRTKINTMDGCTGMEIKENIEYDIQRIERTGEDGGNNTTCYGMKFMDTKMKKLPTFYEDVYNEEKENYYGLKTTQQKGTEKELKGTFESKKEFNALTRKRKRYSIVELLKTHGIDVGKSFENMSTVENNQLEPPMKMKKYNNHISVLSPYSENMMMDEESMIMLDITQPRKLFNSTWHQAVTQLSFVFNDSSLSIQDHIQLFRSCPNLKSLNLPSSNYIQSLFQLGSTISSIKLSGPWSTSVEELNVILWNPQFEMNTMIRTLCAFPNLKRINIACAQQLESSIQNIVNEAHYIVYGEEEDKMSDEYESHKRVQVQLICNTGLEGLKKSIRYRSQLYSKSSEFRSHIHSKFKPLVRFLARQLCRQATQQTNRMIDDEDENTMNEHWWYPYLHGDSSNSDSHETVSLADHQLDMALAVFSETLCSNFIDCKKSTMDWSCSHWQAVSDRFPETGESTIAEYCNSMYRIPRAKLKYLPPKENGIMMYRQRLANYIGIAVDSEYDVFKEEGYIPGLHVIVGDYMPDVSPLEKASRVRKRKMYADDEISNEDDRPYKLFKSSINSVS